MGDFNKDLDRINLAATHIDEVIAKDKENEAIWQKALAENNSDFATDNVDTSWHTMSLPTLWENAGYPDLDGIVWFKNNYYSCSMGR